MRTKILIILIVLVCLGVSGFFIYKNISQPEIKTKEVEKEEVSPIAEEKEEEKKEEVLEIVKEKPEEEEEFILEKEMVSGILFSENFEKGVKNWQLDEGWNLEKIGENYVLKGVGHRWAQLKGKSWDDYALRLKFKMIKGTLHVNFRNTFIEGGVKRYFVSFWQGENIHLSKQLGSAENIKSLNSNSFRFDKNWHTLEIKGYGNLLNVYLDNEAVLIYKDSQPILSGGIAFETLENSEFLIDDVEILRIEEKDIFEKLPLVKVSNTTKSGTLIRDEEWSGEIYVDGWVIVPENITLTIIPGTIVKFRYSRDYKNPFKGHLRVDGGTLRILGTAEKQVWFTSSAVEPINGDWEGIHILNSKNENIVNYAIIEYSTMGVLFFDSSGTVSNSIIRWINNEGIYMERSNPHIENNTIYSVNYNGIAMEQFNYDVIIKGNKIFNIPHNTGIHGEATEAVLENNIIKNNRLGITFDDFCDVIIRNNLIENNSEGISIHFETRGEIKFNKIIDNELGIRGSSSWLTVESNDLYNKKNYEFYEMHQLERKDNCFEKEGKIKISEPIFDYADVKKTELSYNPGDAQDKYPYYFAAEDETRRIVKKIYAERGGFGWSLAWDGSYLWLFGHGGGQDLTKLDPATGKVLASFNVDIAQPHGIAFDGKSLWINDFSSLKVFEVNPSNGKILSSFKIPAMESGASGIAWDGQYLYLVNWVKQEQIYKVDRKGNLLEVVKLKGIGGQSITFDGKYFWVAQCGHEICKYDKQGNLVGKIYQAAEGTWAIAHDGEYLWTLQRTNENWTDPKVYQIEILNDSLIR